MFNIGGGEVLVILIVALIFLGPAKLPEIARTLGKTTQTIRRVSESFRSELDAAVTDGSESQARQRGKEITAKDPSNLTPDSTNPKEVKLETEGNERTSVQENETP